MAMSSSTAILILSWLGIPLTYVVNTVQTLHGERGLFISGTLSLLAICGLTYLAVRRKGRPTDPLFYVFILGTFSSVVDIIIALENDGVIYGFMTNYLKNGEPYLKSAYGTMICYWDGIGHYAMYLMMLAALSWNQPYREVGLYWAGSIGHSMIVLMLGALSGKHGVNYSILLNVPYMFIPFLSAARFLNERPEPEKTSKKEIEDAHRNIRKRPVDMFFIAALVLMFCTAIFRGLTVLDNESPSTLFKWYSSEIEPYLGDPSNFPQLQMLVYVFYFCPYYVMTIYGLLFPGCEWMPDWTILHAGAATQAQVAHIGASLHHRTPYLMRVPVTNTAQLIFWFVNLGLLLIPQLLAVKCNTETRFFEKVIPEQRGKDVKKPLNKLN